MAGKSWLIIVTIVLTFCFTFNLNAKAETEGFSGKQIFEINCAGCHINGGNIIRRGKNLKMRALHRYGYDSVESVKLIVTHGKNNMSAYDDRLSEIEIEKVAQYVIKQAEHNWKS